MQSIHIEREPEKPVVPALVAFSGGYSARYGRCVILPETLSQQRCFRGRVDFVQRHLNRVGHVLLP
jgi:hypothetical protein